MYVHILTTCPYLRISYMCTYMYIQVLKLYICMCMYEHNMYTYTELMTLMANQLLAYSMLIIIIYGPIFSIVFCGNTMLIYT